MSVREQDVLEFVQNLRLRDLRNLVSALEERLGVTAAVPQVSPPPPDPEPVVTQYDVVLIDVGGERLKVLRWIRAELGLTLADARALTEALPATVAQELDADTASALAERLRETGAEVEQRPCT